MMKMIFIKLFIIFPLFRETTTGFCSVDALSITNAKQLIYTGSGALKGSISPK